jgi:hypothetical protein
MSCNRLSLLVESYQSFLYDLRIVIQSSAGLASVQQPSSHFLIAHIEEHQQFDFDLISNNFIPGINVVLISWKSIQ